jgi:hypothetical protein
VDAQGVVSSVVFPPTSSVATTDSLISSLTWTVDVLGTILKDSIKATDTRGYQLSVSSAAVNLVPLGTTIIPAQALVSLTIHLPLQNYYSSVLLQPQQTLISLLSSIVGLLGIIGLFRILFLATEATLQRVSKRRLSAAPLASGTAAQQDEPSVGQTNPLRRGAPHGLASGSAAEVTLPSVISPWTRIEDENSK